MKTLIKTSIPSFMIVLTLALACISVFLPKAQAVSPSPDGGYPGGNTAEGQAALLSLISGGYNTAIGFLSLRNDTAGAFNTAIGAGTLLANIADANTATGAGALLNNTIGANNTANGAFALFNNTTGTGNIALGANAGENLTTGSANIALGANAGLNLTTGSNNIDIGNSGVPGESDTIRIGGTQTSTFIAGISPAFGSTTVVTVNGDGQLGSVDFSNLPFPGARIKTRRWATVL